MKTVFIAHSSMPYANLFKELGYAITNKPEEADMACFTGGADVSPHLYADKKHHTTGNDIHRDEEELKLAFFFEANDIPMVGICRGGQFLNVFSGGRMYQHVDKHAIAGGHAITDLQTGETVHVSSTHHQMMMPSPEAVLVATAALGGSREWFDGQVAKRDVSKEDYEVVFYPKTKALCFQPHPEFNAPEYVGMRNYFAGLIKKYLEDV